MHIELYYKIECTSYSSYSFSAPNMTRSIVKCFEWDLSKRQTTRNRRMAIVFMPIYLNWWFIFVSQIKMKIKFHYAYCEMHTFSFTISFYSHVLWRVENSSINLQWARSVDFYIIDKVKRTNMMDQQNRYKNFECKCRQWRKNK